MACHALLLMGPGAPEFCPERAIGRENLQMRVAHWASLKLLVERPDLVQRTLSEEDLIP